MSVIHSWGFIHRQLLSCWFGSVAVIKLECMFDDATGPELLDAMRDAQRAERVAIAREILAAGRFCQQRLAEAGDEHENWYVDDWEAIAAEVGAELGISQGRASSFMHYGQSLLEHLPTLADVFVSGAVDFRVVSIVVYRTGLITEAKALAIVDDKVARQAPGWNQLSYEKLTQLVDWMVLDVDPEALRVARSRDDDRHIEMGPDQYGMAEIWGTVRATDAAALDTKLNELTGTVCADDPRTKRQRRADALGALADGQTTMGCACESDQCPAAVAAEKRSGGVVIEVIAEAATVEGSSDKPGLLPGYGALPAAQVRELAQRAKLRPLLVPNDAEAQPQYRPSAAMARFIRCRDLTCRWPGCDKAAQFCDIDHTTPWPLGPTHPSNCKLYCGLHHLLKTFYCGIGGWTEQQLPDATLIMTSPNGRTYTTKPKGALFFPQLAAPTGELILPKATSPPSPYRGLCMPTRTRTRAQQRASRIQWERGINAARYAADPPPF